MRPPKITIITATYNAAETLEQSIQSVIQQTYPNIEYIIIDGQSTDGTVDIIKKYSDYIDYWVSEKDAGLYDAINKGIKKATGDYIQIIGADDLLTEKDVISKVAELLADCPEALSTSIYEVDEELGRERSFDHEIRTVGDEKFPWIHHQGLFITREYMLENLFDLRYKIRADLKVLLGLFLGDVKVKYSELHTVYFALSGISTEASNRGIVQLEERLIYKGYGMNYTEDTSLRRKVRKYLLTMLKETKLLDSLRKVKRRYFETGWQKHICNWKFCRWCHHIEK